MANSLALPGRRRRAHEPRGRHTPAILSALQALVGCLSLIGCRDATTPLSVNAPAGPAATLPTLDLPVPTSEAVGPLPPRFENIAASVGIAFERFDDIHGMNRILEANGGGVALFDYDVDGRLDIFFTDGCVLPRRVRDTTHPSRLYRSSGPGRYSEVHDSAALLQFGYSHGCAVGDYNEDGFDDLYVTGFGGNALWRNNGDGTFADVTEETGSASERWGSSAAFADFNRDGCLDLFIVNYLETSDDPPRLCPRPDAPGGYIMCLPAQFPAADDLLLVSDGAGGFGDRTAAAGIVGKDGKGLGVAVSDFDLDGDPDIYVANDGTPNFLYVNETDDPPPDNVPTPDRALRFVERGIELGVALNGDGFAEAGMGIACGDCDGDGWSDLFCTNFYGETNTLYRNLAGSGFLDVTGAVDLAGPSMAVLGFGTVFCDYDGDGRLDLFVANGHIEDRSWREIGGQPYRMPPQLFRNTPDGRFADLSPMAGDYFRSLWVGRGVATGDLDNDLDPDLVVSHQRGPSAVLRNDTDSAPNAIVVRLIGGRAGSSRPAIGARIETEGLALRLTRDVPGGGSYQSAPDRRLHIGLGSAKSASLLRVRWPSGLQDEWRDVRPGRYVLVEGWSELIRASE